MKNELSFDELMTRANRCLSRDDATTYYTIDERERAMSYVMRAYDVFDHVRMTSRDEHDIEQRDVLRIMRELRAMKRDDNRDDIDTICNMLCDVFDV